MQVDPTAFALAADPRQGSEDMECGVLCIHGFTGTAFEMRPLAERLREAGMDCYGPILPGHCTQPGDLDRITWQDWFRTIEELFDELLGRYRTVAVVGQSLGGLLALELAIRRGEQVSALVALATPLWLPPLGTLAVKLARRTPLHRLLPRLPKLGKASDVRDPWIRKVNPSYEVLPTAGVLQLAALMDRVRERLPAVRSPLLVVHGAHDHTAPVACASYLSAQVSSPEVELCILPRSFHLVSLDVEREEVASRARRFLEQHARANAVAPSSPTKSSP